MNKRITFVAPDKQVVAETETGTISYNVELQEVPYLHAVHIVGDITEVEWSENFRMLGNSNGCNGLPEGFIEQLQASVGEELARIEEEARIEQDVQEEQERLEQEASQAETE